MMTDSDNSQCLRGSDKMVNTYDHIYILVGIVTAMFCTGATDAICRSVRQEQRMTHSNSGSTEEENLAMSKSIRTRMLLYTSFFYMCSILPWVFWYVIPNPPYALKMVGYALYPLRGLLNMLAFILPKCQLYQKNHTDTWLPVAYFHVVFDNPTAVVRRWIKFWSSVDQDARSPTSAEDGIGLGTYNTPVETPGGGAGTTAGGGNTPAAGEANDARETPT